MSQQKTKEGKLSIRCQNCDHTQPHTRKKNDRYADDGAECTHSYRNRKGIGVFCPCGEFLPAPPDPMEGVYAAARACVEHWKDRKETKQSLRWIKEDFRRYGKLSKEIEKAAFHIRAIEAAAKETK